MVVRVFDNDYGNNRFLKGVFFVNFYFLATIFIMATNMFTEMRVISLFAMISSVFFLLGAGVIMHFTLQQPSHWSELPASTNFADTVN